MRRLSGQVHFLDVGESWWSCPLSRSPDRSLEKLLGPGPSFSQPTLKAYVCLDDYVMCACNCLESGTQVYGRQSLKT